MVRKYVENTYIIFYIFSKEKEPIKIKYLRHLVEPLYVANSFIREFSI